ncbi:pathogenesis-related genes transcriptional activator PTI5-like [Aegilops tauschii subsp. strangulata]|uniref:pathogenesis-related genes transcriptional activator PTI5-like n=1 Tax=Aegilops tauschii subsp. strangulata TaxID=200361 RepID=UPI000989CBB5|nr:pathogenesis-related genes transcriptional activator PTI5-like [Aegilops tauschii subsp. strangulata]
MASSTLYKNHARAPANRRLRRLSLPSSSPLPVARRRRALLPRLQRPAAVMPPRTRSSSDYRGVRACPFGVYFAEIYFDDTRLRLGTFETAHEATGADLGTYDAAAWRLGRTRAQMNFSDARMHQQAQEDLVPPRG